MKYPRLISRLTGQSGRRVVTVYETAKGRWRIYLKVDGRFEGSQVVTRSRSSAIATAKSWT